MQGRDLRIGELNKAALSHNATIKAMKDAYEAKYVDLSKEHNAKVLALRQQIEALQMMVSALIISKYMLIASFNCYICSVG